MAASTAFSAAVVDAVAFSQMIPTFLIPWGYFFFR